MQKIVTYRQPARWSLRFVAGVALVFLLTLAVFYVVMNPPVGELRPMAAFLSVTAIISVVAGYGAYRLDWLRRSPRIFWTLMGSYGLSSLLTFLNVWVTARLMFASQHDLMLATILLLFATGIAISLGHFFSAAITDQLVALNRAAQRVAEGDLKIRVAVSGRDEVADLAHTFNEMAAQLETAERKQREAEKLRRNLVAWVGHDLRTPLASIRAMLEALADGVVDDPETVQRYLGTARRDIRSLSLLLDDLFEMAQIDAGGLKLERGSNSIGDLISDTLESFSALAAGKGVNLSGDVEPGVDPVWMDAQKIGRVLNNLVSNGLRHTPAGGRVQVRARLSESGVVVEVEDSGEGIRPEDQPHVFDQFYRGEKSRNRETGGVGLGLAIARGIVEAHGGQIDFESVFGQGSCFFFSLP